jgi:hypothetical protein
MSKRVLFLNFSAIRKHMFIRNLCGFFHDESGTNYRA